MALPDPVAPSFPSVILGYDPIPFPSTMICSDDDPYATVAQTRLISRRLGCSLISVGSNGHINAESGLVDWEQGKSILRQLLVERLS